MYCISTTVEYNKHGKGWACIHQWTTKALQHYGFKNRDWKLNRSNVICKMFHTAVKYTGSTTHLVTYLKRHHSMTVKACASAPASPASTLDSSPVTTLKSDEQKYSSSKSILFSALLANMLIALDLFLSILSILNFESVSLKVCCINMKQMEQKYLALRCIIQEDAAYVSLMNWITDIV